VSRYISSAGTVRPPSEVACDRRNGACSEIREIQVFQWIVTQVMCISMNWTELMWYLRRGNKQPWPWRKHVESCQLEIGLGKKKPGSAPIGLKNKQTDKASRLSVFNTTLKPVHTSLYVRVAWHWWLGHLPRSPGTGEGGDWWSWPMGVKAKGMLRVCQGASSNFRIP